MLFDEQTIDTIPIEDGELLLVHHLYDDSEQRELFETLSNEIRWRQDSLTMGARVIPIPRLQAWYGDPEATYTYSGLRMEPTPWTPILKNLKTQCEHCAETSLNSMLANFYRNGQDSVSWHADDEKELGLNPIIASLSLGSTRRFQLRHKFKSELPTLKLDLEGGSLLIMRGTTQTYWKHQISKTKRAVGGRINLTFRQVY